MLATKIAQPTMKELKILYSNVLKGHTVFYIDNIKKAYIKHLNIFDSVDTDKSYQSNLEEAKKQKLPTEEEQIEYLISEDLWSKENEKNIVEYSKYLLNLEDTKSKLFMEAEVNQIKKQIEEVSEKLKKLRYEKLKLVGLTAEAYAEKRSNEEYMRYVLYKDKEFKEPYFTEEEFDDLSNEDLNTIFAKYGEANRPLAQGHLKKLALASFFANFYYLCDDNPYTFFGKPVYSLTFHQTEMFAYARYFKGLAQDAKVKAPREIHDDPDALIEFYEGTKNAQEAQEKMTQGKGAAGAGASTIVGASKKDMEKMGYGKQQGIDLIAEANKRGGKLTMEDFADIHGDGRTQTDN